MSATTTARAAATSTFREQSVFCVGLGDTGNDYVSHAIVPMPPERREQLLDRMALARTLEKAHGIQSITFQAVERGAVLFLELCRSVDANGVGGGWDSIGDVFDRADDECRSIYRPKLIITPGIEGMVREVDYLNLVVTAESVRWTASTPGGKSLETQGISLAEVLDPAANAAFEH